MSVKKALPPKAKNFLDDLVELLKKHEATMGACSCCNYINFSVDGKTYSGLAEIDKKGYNEMDINRGY